MTETVKSTNIPAIHQWHRPDWQQLTRQFSEQQLHHALLLTGNKGTGKQLFGQRLAAFLMCRQPVNTNPCGQCKDCLLFLAGSHPDILNLAPEEKSRFIKIDAIRHANSFLTNKSQMNGYKVVIINQADALNLNAANALLKNLEEPAPQTLFILVSDQPGQIPATIRSRCCKILLALPGEEQVKQWLMEHCPQYTSQIDLAVALSGRAPLLARQLLEDGGLEDRQKVLKGLVKLHKKQMSAADIAREWQSLDILATLDWIIVWIADLIKFKMSRDETAVNNTDMIVFLSKIVHLVLLDELYLNRDRIQKLRQAVIAGHNPNKTLLLEGILLDWSKCFR